MCISLALGAFAVILSTTFVYDFDMEIQTVDYDANFIVKVSCEKNFSFLEVDSPSRTILNTRRPFQQINYRHQRGNQVQGVSARDTPLKARYGNFPESKTKDLKKSSGYPSNAVFRKSKEYYVFTLKRILC